jgi:8-oxo-dGTP diphosphatase
MKTYVVGLMFDDRLEHIALIKKTKPEWQRGKLNGVGGKIEAGESPINAMVREFHEETGALTLPARWQYFLRMEGTENGDQGRADGAFTVDFFCCSGDLSKLLSKTEEPVEIHVSRRVMAHYEPCLENVPWVIGLAIDFLQDGRPSFTTAKYFS